MTLWALKRAALLIKEIAGGSISSDIVDVYPQPLGDFEVELQWANIRRLIGKDLEPALIKNILEALDIRVVTEQEGGLTAAVPPDRVDVQREADVVEEILRVYGYNNVEVPTSIHSTIVYRSEER